MADVVGNLAGITSCLRIIALASIFATGGVWTIAALLAYGIHKQGR